MKNIIGIIGAALICGHAYTAPIIGTGEPPGMVGFGYPSKTPSGETIVYGIREWNNGVPSIVMGWYSDAVTVAQMLNEVNSRNWTRPLDRLRGIYRAELVWIIVPKGQPAPGVVGIDPFKV